VSEDPVDPTDRQKAVIAEIKVNTDETVDAEGEEIEADVVAAVGAKVDETETDILAGVGAAKGDVIAQIGTLAEKVDEIPSAVDLIGEDVTQALERLAELETARSADRAALDKYVVEINAKLDALRDGGPKGDGTWRDAPDLIDSQFRPVLGIHTGGDGATKSDPVKIAEQMGQPIQVAPIYWTQWASPGAACQRMLDTGTLPRLELCLPHIFTAGGTKMSGTFWTRVADGDFDEELEWLLDGVAELDQPILLSAGHESDMRSEDGASPKAGDPPAGNYCGDWSDFPGYWEQFATLARATCPKARLFLNFSGGYSGAPSRWDTMLPAAGTFDFFGYDPYNQYGKAGSKDWQSFEQRLKLFGRWDWYKRTIPDVPVIIGETATCQGPGGDKDAGRWLLDMVDFMAENRWQGVGTGGGISQVHYFSHHYADHPRCLDEPHNGTGQMWDVLPQIGADARLAWAG
jgi:hypothetical protein